MPETYKANCDMCGVEKRETNRWFGVNSNDGYFTAAGWNFREIGNPVYCGEKCLTKALSQWLEKQPK